MRTRPKSHGRHSERGAVLSLVPTMDEAQMTPANDMVMQITIQNRNGLVMDTRQISFSDLGMVPTDSDYPLGVTIDVVELAATHNFVVMYPPAHREIPAPAEPDSGWADEDEEQDYVSAYPAFLTGALEGAHNPPFTPATPAELTRPYTGDTESPVPGAAVAGGRPVERGYWEPPKLTAGS